MEGTVEIEHVSDESKDNATGPKCPECGEELAFIGHCGTCYSCGFSQCSL